MENNFISNLAIFLIESGSLKFGKFRLSSGQTSNYYVDLRTIQSFPSIFRQIITEIESRIRAEGLEFDCLATVPTSGLIFTSALAYEMFKPFIYIRKESKGYGANNLIEGKIGKYQKILLIDDVITTGKSLEHAINIIRDNGATVNDAMTILYRGSEMTRKKFLDKGINLRSLFTIKDLADYLYRNDIIDDEKRLQLQK